ncbi:VOC family protein [Luteolibacter flavescens]|uniref:VOC family protein n=1 Tax=Luteolibacter flavescens TaxID=1859460 RepID=A0ABT3FJN4_9BACT|nr:VOC family protein [Luteolibacter flavescens]MCW1883772.1 VOC family protein [Luteolibacter flavescens]
MSQRGLLHHMIINVRDVARSSPFYTAMFRYLGYELGDSSYGADYGFEDWKRWDLDTPHEISICQVRDPLKRVPHQRGALGHHCHIAFCAESREDVDRFHREVLVPLAEKGLCTIEDAPCDCPEYNEGYYATFFTDPDGLKFEFVINPNHLIKKAARDSAAG